MCHKAAELVENAILIVLYLCRKAAGIDNMHFSTQKAHVGGDGVFVGANRLNAGTDRYRRGVNRNKQYV